MNATKVTKWARSERGNTLIRHAVSHRDLRGFDNRETLIAYCGTALYSGATWVEGQAANATIQTMAACKRCAAALDKAATETAAETAVHANTPGAVATPLCGKRYGAVPADGQGVNCPDCAAASPSPRSTGC